jgi:ABC-type lipoprotein export system ATPase subunit
MDESDTERYPRGSEWRRWDPHLHAPGTLLSDQFGGDWEKYLRRVESSSPTVQALGVTDYFCIQTYREVRKRKAAGRLPKVELIFPNVEMRLDLKTEKRKAINIHLLFSPDDPNHEAEVERVLAELAFEFRDRKYRCMLADLAKLGQAFDPGQTDEPAAVRAGANQFKITLSDLRELFRSDVWLRNNCLVAVAGGLGDGTAGLQQDDSFAATRREIEAFAHIIFASTRSSRDFWLGKKPGFDRAYIEATYRSLKPCLHGSDAHREETVAAPDADRYCWIKGDLTFEALRQAVIEPEERVWIGSACPAVTPSASICRVRSTETPWLKNEVIELNAGMVAVIGARGSGKTALVDIIASGANAMGSALDESSFLKRASSPVDYLENARVELAWADDSTSETALSPRLQGEPEDRKSESVCYLSQHFVERLCSSAGLATELRGEMERVVFAATDPTERLEATSFEELANTSLEPIRWRRTEILSAIQSATESIVQEDLLRTRLPKMRADRDSLAKEIEQARKNLQSLLPKGKEVRARYLTQLEQVCVKTEANVENLRRRRKALDDLAAEVAHISTSREPSRFADMRRRFAALELSDTEWIPFGMKFKGDVDGVLDRAKRLADIAISTATDGVPNSPVELVKLAPNEWPLNYLKATRDAVKKDVGIDTQQQKKYDELQRWLSQHDTSFRRLELEIKNAEAASTRLREFINLRRAAYSQIFDALVEEEEVLRRLYAPLKRELGDAAGALSKLDFVVQRLVNLDAWVKAGENLLDLRKETKFRGHGALRTEAESHLLQAWRFGTAEDVGAAMDAFRVKFQPDLVKAMPGSVSPDGRPVWLQSVGAWLYDTSHISIEYGIQYDGVAIEQLSPGTRGIVLLLLYLAVDRQDRRPLIIDQPEENLDPRSVFVELVPHFREARKRRQVIVVTHNANLVVNTDADQVIVATSVQAAGKGLPTISYRGGSLENPDIRSLVCEILEGGERAFLERERRYRLRWEEAIALPASGRTEKTSG